MEQMVKEQVQEIGVARKEADELMVKIDVDSKEAAVAKEVVAREEAAANDAAAQRARAELGALHAARAAATPPAPGPG